MSMASLVAERFRYVLHEKLAPHTPEFGMAVGTILTYWAAALFYDLLDRLDAPWVRRYRVVRKQPGRANLVTKGQVVTRVLLQHAVQFILGFVLLLVDPDQCDAKQPGGWAISCLQFAAGMLIMDTWQFWIHRWMHVNPTLYKHIHSHHHRLLVPYAYGALYNHPLEGLMLDTVGGVLALYGSGMSCKVGVWCLNFATLKTVLDHCGYLFPINPLHDCFPNSAAYHDVHHDIRFIKKNYSQPFFVHWDWIMGACACSGLPVPVQGLLSLVPGHVRHCVAC